MEDSSGSGSRNFEKQPRINRQRTVIRRGNQQTSGHRIAAGIDVPRVSCLLREAGSDRVVGPAHEPFRRCVPRQLARAPVTIRETGAFECPRNDDARSRIRPLHDEIPAARQEIMREEVCAGHGPNDVERRRRLLRADTHPIRDRLGIENAVTARPICVVIAGRALRRRHRRRRAPASAAPAIHRSGTAIAPIFPVRRALSDCFNGREVAPRRDTVYDNEDLAFVRWTEGRASGNGRAGVPLSSSPSLRAGDRCAAVERISFAR